VRRPSSELVGPGQTGAAADSAMAAIVMWLIMCRTSLDHIGDVWAVQECERTMESSEHANAQHHPCERPPLSELRA
jgi:hypothetical protein